MDSNIEKMRLSRNFWLQLMIYYHLGKLQVLSSPFFHKNFQLTPFPTLTFAYVRFFQFFSRTNPPFPPYQKKFLRRLRRRHISLLSYYLFTDTLDYAKTKGKETSSRIQRISRCFKRYEGGAKGWVKRYQATWKYLSDNGKSLLSIWSIEKYTERERRNKKSKEDFHKSNYSLGEWHVNPFIVIG